MCCWRLISRWNGLSPSKRTGRLAQEWSVRRRDPYRQRGIKLKGMRLQRPEHWDRMGGIEERRTLDGRESEIIAFKRLSSKESTRSLNKGLSCIHIIIYNYICIYIYIQVPVMMLSGFTLMIMGASIGAYVHTRLARLGHSYIINVWVTNQMSFVTVSFWYFHGTEE